MLVSAIVPTYKVSKDTIVSLLNVLKNENIDEVIVVSADEQSSLDELRDDLINMFDGDFIKVIYCAKNRGRQMDLGAFHARGDVLIFLHSDNLVENGFMEEARKYLNNDDISGVALKFKANSKQAKYRLFNQLVYARNRVLGLIYGDQGLIVSKYYFKKVFGFRGMKLMEDVSIVRRLKKLGKVKIINKESLVNVTRFEKKGIIRNTFKNMIMLSLYFLGVREDKLFRLYYNDLI